MEPVCLILGGKRPQDYAAYTLLCAWHKSLEDMDFLASLRALIDIIWYNLVRGIRHEDAIGSAQGRESRGGLPPGPEHFG